MDKTDSSEERMRDENPDFVSATESPREVRLQGPYVVPSGRPGGWVDGVEGSPPGLYRLIYETPRLKVST